MFAHQLGLGVILDVVYNHFGHEGNYLPQFASEYLTDRIKNPWGRGSQLCLRRDVPPCHR